MVFPDGGRLDHQTGGIQLQQRRQMLVGNVFQEGVSRQVGDTAQVELIPEADDGPGILIRPGFGDIIAGAELFHQQRGGNVRVQTDVHHKTLEMVLP